MNNIEVRSEKVRNIIGAVPPFIVRLGNVFIVLLILLLVAIASIVHIPKTIEGTVVTETVGSSSEFYLISIEKLVDEPIPQGCVVRVFKDGKMLLNGVTQIVMKKINVEDEKLVVKLPVKVESQIKINEMQFFIKNGAKFHCEIVLPSKSLLSNVLD